MPGHYRQISSFSTFTKGHRLAQSRQLLEQSSTRPQNGETDPLESKMRAKSSVFQNWRSQSVLQKRLRTHDVRRSGSSRKTSGRVPSVQRIWAKLQDQRPCGAGRGNLRGRLCLLYLGHANGTVSKRHDCGLCCSLPTRVSA